MRLKFHIPQGAVLASPSSLMYLATILMMLELAQAFDEKLLRSLNLDR